MEQKSYLFDWKFLLTYDIVTASWLNDTSYFVTAFLAETFSISPGKAQCKLSV